MSHPVPDTLLDQHLAILGKTGSGKSYATRGLVERLLDQGRRVAILDYTGVWSGLRASADGRKAGYPVVIFGGEAGDIPISEKAGVPIAQIVAEGSAPVVIDLDGMTIGAQQRFVTSFLEELYRLNREPLHLVLEECDELAPQQGSPGTERMLGAVARIFQRGRAKGFRAIAVTQRPANLHKRVLTQCNAIIALRLLAPQDRKALGEWIKGHGDSEQGQEVTDSLPKLQRGEGWIWSPEDDVLERVAFPAIKTFDTMSAPTEGSEPRRGSKGWARVDLDEIRRRLSTEIETIDANDPKTLKRRIAELEATAARLKAGVRDPRRDADLDEIRAEGVAEGRQAERSAWLFRLARLGGDISAIMADAASLAATALRLAESDLPLETRLSDFRSNEHAPNPDPARPDPIKTPPARVTKSKTLSQRVPDSLLSGPETTLLQALAWWDAIGKARPSRAMVCAVAGWRVTAGHIKNVAGSLRSKGLIDYPEPGRLALTPAGAARTEPRRDTHVSVADFVRATLSGPQSQVFDELVTRPKGLDRDALCEALGWNASSGHIKNVLGSMRSMEIVEYPTPGSVRLVPWIME